MSEPGDPYALSAEERALLPSDDDVAFYQEHGWYVSPKLFRDTEIDELWSSSEEFYRGRRDRTLPARPPHLSYWTEDKGDVQRHNDYIHYEKDAIARILRKPLIGAVAARLAAVEEIRLFQSTLILKPPRPDEPSNLVPWHNDRDYWATSSSERMLTAFIPFHDCDESMGTLTMVDGSHHWRKADSVTARHFNELGSGMEEVLQRRAAANGAEIRKIPMRLAKGQVSFHHCRTYHGSGPNRSSAPRRAISLHLQDGGNTYRAFRLADGTPAVYNHDVLVRRTADGRPDYADPRYCPAIWTGTSTPS